VTFRVALIPTTLAHTTLGSRAVGDTVNLEVDVVAKYVERLTVGYVPGAGASEKDAGHREAGPVSSGDDAAEQQAVGS
jgi:riboflavin synthase